MSAMVTGRYNTENCIGTRIYKPCRQDQSVYLAGLIDISGLTSWISLKYHIKHHNSIELIIGCKELICVKQCYSK